MISWEFLYGRKIITEAINIRNTMIPLVDPNEDIEITIIDVYYRGIWFRCNIKGNSFDSNTIYLVPISAIKEILNYTY